MYVDSYYLRKGMKQDWVGKVIHHKSCCEDPLGKNGKVVLSLQGTKTETKYDVVTEKASLSRHGCI